MAKSLCLQQDNKNQDHLGIQQVLQSTLPPSSDWLHHIENQSTTFNNAKGFGVSCFSTDMNLWRFLQTHCKLFRQSSSAVSTEPTWLTKSHLAWFFSVIYEPPHQKSIATGAEKHILPNVPDLNKNKLLPISSNGFSYVNAVWLLQTIFFLLSPAPLHLRPCSIIAKKLHNPKTILHYTYY